MDKAEQPTITQADREAAEAVYPAFLASLRGEDGGYRLAEAFARHRTTSLAAQDGLVEALTYLESEARRFAGMYPEASDGRNTFLIFADKIASVSAIKGDKS